MKPLFSVRELSEKEFEGIINLGNKVHGENYLSYKDLRDVLHRSIKNETNCSFSLVKKDIQGEQVVGFRLTYAPGMWEIDKWCSPERWGVSEHEVCYFKCNTIDENLRGSGLGKMLLNRSIIKVKKQGAVAGLAHIWMGSPDNIAYKYFSRVKGQLVELHPRRWREKILASNGTCSKCGTHCECDGAEMIIYFEE